MAAQAPEAPSANEIHSDPPRGMRVVIRGCFTLTHEAAPQMTRIKSSPDLLSNWFRLVSLPNHAWPLGVLELTPVEINPKLRSRWAMSTSGLGSTRFLSHLVSAPRFPLYPIGMEFSLHSRRNMLTRVVVKKRVYITHRSGKCVADDHDDQHQRVCPGTHFP